MAGSVRVAAVQMSSGDNIGDNLRLADSLLVDAARSKCGMALLPENFALMGLREEDKVDVAEDPGSGLIQEFLADAARRHQMWLVAGSLPLKSRKPGLCFGASILFDDKGTIQATYRKIHLFDVDIPERDESYRESATMDRGDERVVADSPIGKLGLTICYDVRFPGLYRSLCGDGAVAFSVPAAFTQVTGEAHWHTLLRARAIENLAFVFAPAQHGRHSNGRTTFGHSMIVDPWGQILAEQASGDGLAIADVDLELPARLRTAFPVLEHRRGDNRGKCK